MEQIFSWGSPVGLGLFLFLQGVGVGVFFWGIAKLTESETRKKERQK